LIEPSSGAKRQPYGELKPLRFALDWAND